MYSQKYNTLHKYLAYNRDKPTACENCGRTGCRLEFANVSGEYLRDKNDYVSLCVYCHRAIDNNGAKASFTADIKRKENPCKYGHAGGIYKTAIKSRRGRYYRRCKECQSIASKRYYNIRKFKQGGIHVPRET